MFADILLSTSWVVLLSGVWVLSLLALAAALWQRVRLTRHMQGGRDDLRVGRDQMARARERTRTATFQALIIGRGAETDAERLARLRADAEVRARGALRPGGEGA